MALLCETSLWLAEAEPHTSHVVYRSIKSGDRMKDGAPRQALSRTAAVAGMAMGVFWAAGRFAAEPLLACVLAGVVATNRR